MSGHGSLSRTVIILVATVTVVMVAIFCWTHGAWYDLLKPEQRTQFWNEALVAYGTLALAVVTWASVAETQLVLADEDLRFRRGRMPVIIASEAAQSTDGGFQIVLENIGDGAARDVILSFSSHVRTEWNNSGSADNRDQMKERDYSTEEFLFASYLPQKESLDCTFGRPTSVTMVMSPLITTTVHSVHVVYHDVFASKFSTEYRITKGQPFNPQDFIWHAPPELVPPLKRHRKT